MERRQIRRHAALAGMLCASLLAPPPARANLSRNASGPRNMGEAGALTLDTAGQLEYEADGRIWTVETGAQYELSSRWQFLIEAVCFERQAPGGEEAASGIGDTDVTLSYMILGESGPLPPVALAARVKLPTASHADLGTGKADVSGLLVLAKEVGELEINLEMEYATFGSPAGEKLDDQLLYTFSLDYSASDLLSVYGELFGNSAPSAAESRTDAALAGVEIDIPVSEAVAPYLSLEVDTEGVSTARAGIEWTW